MTWQTARRPRKFVKGPKVLGIWEALQAVQEGRYTLFHDKPMHHAVLRNWSIVQIESACRSGQLYHANPNPAHPTNVIEDEPSKVEP